MKKSTVSKEKITLEEVVENFKILRLWYYCTCVISAFMILCMTGAAVWGILDPDFRWIIISAGIVLGICGIVLFIVVRGIYIKTSSAVLDYFRLVCKMPDAEILQKAQELKIPKKAIKTNQGGSLL